MLEEFSLLTSLLLLGFSAFSTDKQKVLRVATYNLRFDNVSDTVNAWGKRFPVIVDQIRFHDFDIFGSQEGLYHQLQDMTKALPDYDYIGVGRADGARGGEFEAIFYRKDKFTLLQQGNFWFSLTPDIPSIGWDADLPRLCTWGQFEERSSGFSFYFFNVHFDWLGKKARKESVHLVQQKIRHIAGDAPVILTGDFNFSEKEEDYALLSTSETLKDAFHLAEIRLAPRGTFNAFEIDKNSDDRIDHIWLTSDFKVQRYGILTETYGDGKFPSDHFPVVTDLQYEIK